MSSINNHRTGGVLFVSLIINVVFLILSAYLIIHFKENIIAKIQQIKQKPSDEILATFNNEPLEAVNDSLMVGADSTITCLFLGNSLTYTGVPDEEPDKEKRGMTSTSKEKDYVHVLVGLIAENNRVNVKYGIVNISGFERTFTKRSFQSDKLGNIVHQRPDYLIVQIGENVSKADMKNPSKFEEEYLKLLSLFPNSKRIVTTPFWPDKEKEYAITSSL